MAEMLVIYRILEDEGLTSDELDSWLTEAAKLAELVEKQAAAGA